MNFFKIAILPAAIILMFAGAAAADETQTRKTGTIYF